MSDDRYLGTTCFCIPRRAFAVLAALVIALYGLIVTCRLVLWEWLPGPMERQPHCHGRRCDDILTCQGMEEASYHTVTVVRVIGCLVFGSWGIFGAIHGHVSELQYLAMFLASMAGVLVAAAALDGLYMTACGTYPFNIISEALIWVYPGLPISDILKSKIMTLQGETYNIKYLNALTGRNIWHHYLLTELPFVALWAYVAHEVALLARLNAYGMVGLGANFSIQGWREEVILKNQLRDDLLSANRLARASAGDVGWRPDAPGDRAAGAGKGLGGFLYKQGGYGTAGA